jgi:hypothetical protein
MNEFVPRSRCRSARACHFATRPAPAAPLVATDSGGGAHKRTDSGVQCGSAASRPGASRWRARSITRGCRRGWRTSSPTSRAAASRRPQARASAEGQLEALRPVADRDHPDAARERRGGRAGAVEVARAMAQQAELTRAAQANVNVWHSRSGFGGLKRSPTRHPGSRFSPNPSGFGQKGVLSGI